METISYTAARNALATTMSKVCQDHVPIIITRNNADSVVMMSLEDFNAIQETAYLLRSTKNAERLRESIKQAEDNQLKQQGLIEK